MSDWKNAFWCVKNWSRTWATCLTKAKAHTRAWTILNSVKRESSDFFRISESHRIKPLDQTQYQPLSLYWRQTCAKQLALDSPNIFQLQWSLDITHVPSDWKEAWVVESPSSRKETTTCRPMPVSQQQPANCWPVSLNNSLQTTDQSRTTACKLLTSLSHQQPANYWPVSLNVSLKTTDQSLTAACKLQTSLSQH